MWEAKRISSGWLYEINKVPAYSLYVRDIPAYISYLSSSGTVNQIDVIVIIIASVNASDNAVLVRWVLLVCSTFFPFQIVLLVLLVLFVLGSIPPFYSPLSFEYYYYY